MIGIHIDCQKKRNCNVGEIIKFANNDFNNKNNYIIAENEEKEKNINKDIRITNSCEKNKSEKKLEDSEKDYKNENEKEKKEKFEIKINN